MPLAALARRHSSITIFEFHTAVELLMQTPTVAISVSKLSRCVAHTFLAAHTVLALEDLDVSSIRQPILKSPRAMDWL